MSHLINNVKVEDDYTLEYAANPKRNGCKAWTRYETYSQYETVGEYLKKCALDDSMKKYARADLRYDHEHGHLKIYNLDGECMEYVDPNGVAEEEPKEATA